MNILIILGGDPPEEVLTREMWQWADKRICADSGANMLPSWDLWPDVLVGDMDSVDEAVLEAMKVRHVRIVRHHPHKDLTDGQLACQMTLELGADEVTLLGGWGGYADHSYANLMLLRYLAQAGVKARMGLPGQWVQVFGPGRHRVPGPAGSRFSLLPISEDVCVSAIYGAEYPIIAPTAMPMSGDPSGPIGISNHIADPEAGFQLDQGWILCFYSI